MMINMNKISADNREAACRLGSFRKSADDEIAADASACRIGLCANSCALDRRNSRASISHDVLNDIKLSDIKLRLIVGHLFHPSEFYSIRRIKIKSEFLMLTFNFYATYIYGNFIIYLFPCQHIFLQTNDFAEKT